MVRSIVFRISTAVAVALTIGAVLVATGSSATANNGDAVKAGQTTTATAGTAVSNTNVSLSCTAGANDGLVGCGDTGLFGNGTTYGVHGFGTTAGVLGVGTTGVSGVGGSLNGVEGVTASSTASGVYGENDSTGFGVAGRANDGIAVLADSTNGVALEVNGEATFSRSGIATVQATKSKVKVSGIGLTSASLVLATIQGNVAGTWVRGVSTDPGTSSFTIFLNQAAAANTTVAWFVVN